jgi:RNA polymerase sigma-70 factor, ECF subfamily
VCTFVSAPSRPIVVATNPAVGLAAEAGGVAVVDCALVPDLVVAWEFEDMYRREYAGLMAVATALTGDRHGAQDLVHDTMVKALVRWDRVARLERPGAWCHHVLVNVCRSRVRRRATEWRYLAGLRRVEPSTPEPSADTIAFWTAARTLPSRPRAVVALYFGADMTSVQIGEILGVPEGTVRSDLSVARRVIMGALRGHDD